MWRVSVSDRVHQVNIVGKRLHRKNYVFDVRTKARKFSTLDCGVRHSRMRSSMAEGARSNSRRSGEPSRQSWCYRASAP